MDDLRAPFELSGDERAVVLVHGFTGTPFEMSALAQRLHAGGMTVWGIRLPGHGTTPEALERTPWTDWYRALDQAVAELTQRGHRVAVVGQSLGGLLALHLAARDANPVAAVASLAAPLWLTPTARALIAVCRRVPVLTATLGPIAKRNGSDIADLVMKAKNPSYPVIPLGALVEFDRVRAVVRAELEQVRTPLLLIHSTQDHVAPYRSMGEIARRVASRQVATVTLTHSYHLIALDVERERVATEVASFVDPRLRDEH